MDILDPVIITIIAALISAGPGTVQLGLQLKKRSAATQLKDLLTNVRTTVDYGRRDKYLDARANQNAL